MKCRSACKGAFWILSHPGGSGTQHTSQGPGAPATGARGRGAGRRAQRPGPGQYPLPVGSWGWLSARPGPPSGHPSPQVQGRPLGACALRALGKHLGLLLRHR